MDLYVAGAGWLQRTDPRVKLVAAALMTAVLSAVAGLWLLFVWLVVVHVLLLGSGIPRSRLGWAWRATAPVLVSVVVLWPVFASEGDHLLLAIGPLVITVEELGRGCATGLRIGGLALTWLAVLFTTDQARLVRGLVRFGLSHRAGMLVVLALRSIWLLSEVYSGVLDAQQARGLIIRGRNPIAQARARLPILVVVVVNALRMVDSLTLSLSARGFDSTAPRSVYRELRMTGTDWVLLAVAIAGCGGLLLVRVALGWGTQPLGFP